MKKQNYLWLLLGFFIVVIVYLRARVIENNNEVEVKELGYLICLESGKTYRILIYDSSGNEVYKWATKKGLRIEGAKGDSLFWDMPPEDSMLVISGKGKITFYGDDAGGGTEVFRLDSNGILWDASGPLTFIESHLGNRIGSLIKK